MKVLIKMLRPLIKRYLCKALENEENRNYLTKIANDKIDIPKLTEKDEEKLLCQLYDALAESAVTFIDRI